MISRLCKTLFPSRVAATATAAGSLVALKDSKDSNFLRKALSLIPVSNRYCISTNAADKHSFTVSYLIKSCGLSPQSALSVSKKVHFETPENPDSVISFLRNNGFSFAQITNVIEKCPRLLLYNADKYLRPRVEFFYSKGFTSSNLSRLLNSSPYILRLSLDRSIIPKFNSLKNFTRAEDKRVLYALAVCASNLHHYNYMSSNIRILQEYGVPVSYTASAVLSSPTKFIVKHDIFKAAVEEVKKMGFNPFKYTFVDAVLIFVIKGTRKPVWERKYRLYRKWGWSDEEFWFAVRKVPRVMRLRESNVNAKMDFYINKMGYNSQYFANHPILLHLSLENRIIPRCSVLQYLTSKGLIKEDYSVTSMLMYSEKIFLQKCLTPYADPHLLKLYEKKLIN